ncbi:MAG: FAD-binding oxidoreductase [Pseudomonadales bacterium]|nr:FAD-binding oxidoreductase [Pseudomonadales bacterium]MBO6656028.1 FAD-binding oxidoreductase [Pseudomonadales bacterium]MBO6703398.1 FAD-binding oxidoreductase [Pseudomonadales bacterium]MBO7004505.1 FAD-binding oxidoreductase [Pseudomonadales bacterium]
MDRRAFLKLSAAAALAGVGQHKALAKGLRVVVAGAGIVGVSIAYQLAKAGAVVTVIDKEGPATHASRGTFAWINATWAKQPRHYHRFSQDGLESWKTFQGALSLPIRWGGSLEWFDGEARQQRLVEQIAEQVAWGEPARMIDANEFKSLEPHVKIPEGLVAAYSPNDGAIDPVMATQKLLDAARALGATVVFPSALVGTSMVKGRLSSVQTSGGHIPADRLVLATGAEAQLPQQISGLEIPQRSTPGVIVITKPMPRLLNRIIVAPGVHIHQREDGRIVLGEQAGAPNTEAHAQRLRNRPNVFPDEAIAHQHGGRILASAFGFVPDIRRAEIESVYIGWRPLPLDGHPVLGANPEQPDVYLAIMHSGVSLAPIVGQLVAQELSGGVAIDQLAPYRPTRTFQRVERY